MADETRDVPAAALCFQAGPVQFAQNDEEGPPYPVELLARTGDPVEHWYWGRVVHDVEGARHGERIAIDWRHLEDELLGYADEFDTRGGDLRVKGKLTPYGEDDRGHEIAHKGRAGVPYEASIDFRGQGIRAEELGEGATAQVNGRTVTGPCVIFREWPLRAVAICKVGQDPGTETTFQDDNPTFSVTVTRGENEMPDTDTPTNEQKRSLWAALGAALGLGAADPAPEASTDTPGDAPSAPATDTPPAEPQQQAAPPAQPPAEPQQQAAPPAQPPADKAADPRAECKRYVEAFGPEGATWWAEGKTWCEASALALEAARKENAELRQRIDQAELGDPNPAEADPDAPTPEDQRQNRFALSLGPRLGAFASELRLPKRGRHAEHLDN
jgi:hypothetical protein